jgi:hypothetical protein
MTIEDGAEGFRRSQRLLDDLRIVHSHQ